MDGHDPAALRRARRIARLGGAIAGVVGGLAYAAYLIPNSGGLLDRHYATAVAALTVCCLLGLVCGFLVGPSLSVDSYAWLRRTVDSASGGELAGGVAGLVLGLVVAALVTVPLLRLPDGLGLFASLGVTAGLVYLGVSVGTRRRDDLLSLASQLASTRATPAASGAEPTVAPRAGGVPVLVDTSVLIDGRVLDVARTGFLVAPLLVPGFVLEELQRVADSGDPLRRARGRRGLSTVEELQRLDDPPCQVVDVDFPGVVEVDSRLLRLARARGAAIMTNDYMLNRLAQIEGIRVLNVNDLALALKPIVSAGESMEVSIVKEGKELHQGVGYLDDGTMVVVENGRAHLDEVITATVTSVIQTPAGRMIFALAPVAAEAAVATPVAAPSRPRPARSTPRLPRTLKR